MVNTLKGRPRLNLGMGQILDAVRRPGQVLAAADELSCSDAYIHVRLKKAGLTLGEVFNTPNLEALLCFETQNFVAEIKVRAEGKPGQWNRAMPKNGR